MPLRRCVPFKLHAAWRPVLQILGQLRRLRVVEVPAAQRQLPQRSAQLPEGRQNRRRACQPLCLQRQLP